MNDFIHDDELPAFVALLNKYNGNMSRMSKGEGISYDVIKRRKRRAVRQGLWDIKHSVPYGMEVHSITDQVDGYGNIINQSIKMGDPRGEKFVAPAGQRIKGVSALVDGEGNEKIKWIKTEKDQLSLEQIATTVREAFDGYKPSRPAIIKPLSTIEEMMTVYPVLDWHLGMFAWGLETGGPDWDLSIAKKAIVSNYAELVSRSPKSSTAVFMCLGDILHADNSDNMTKRSKNVLSVDSRRTKILFSAAEVLIECVGIAASHHGNLEVAMKRGNHDDESTAALLLAMTCEFRTSKHIVVDDSPNFDFYYKRFGTNLIGGTHGDKVKFNKLGSTMANHRKEDWSLTSTRHYFTGHLHHMQSKEEDGVVGWTLRAPIPQDDYHSGHAYVSGQSMYAFNYHVERGSRGHNELEIDFD